jgi:glycosyltransferase involved in cell wall biosynthesis
VPARLSAVAPTVSVLLPVHNAAGSLRRAVESIRRQTCADWELVAVDDGSTDGSAALLEAAARDEPRLRVLRRPHEGIVAALQAGLAAARGGLVARMDADDESHGARLEEQAKFLEAHPDIGVVGCLVGYGGDRTANAGYARHVDWLNTLVTPDQIALNRFIESPFAHPSVMFRRELAERHGGYRAGEFPEDYELWLRWAEAGVRMAKVPRVLLTWHDPAGRLSRTDSRYDAEAFYRVKAAYLARALARDLRGRRLFVWGAGRPTRKRAAHLEAEGCAIAGYVDIDPKKTGRSLAGRPVIPPTALPPPGGIFVLGYVASRGARELIRGELARRGYAEGRDFLMCA